MASFVKIWTDVFNDSWFISLNGTERSIWLQLIIYAKLTTDSGRVCARSMTHLSQILACHRHSCGKFLSRCATDKKISYTKSDTGIEIHLTNYEYWQRVRTAKDTGSCHSGAKRVPHKSHKIRADKKDKIREDKRVISSDKSDHSQFIKFFCIEYEKTFGAPYGFDGGKDGAIVKTLLNQFKSYDLLCQMTVRFFECEDNFIRDKMGFTIAGLKTKANQLAMEVTSHKMALDKIKKEKSEPKKKKDGWGKPKFHGYK